MEKTALRGSARRGSVSLVALAAAAATVIGLGSTFAAEAPKPAAAPALSLGEILEQSPASDWEKLDPNNTLYMELPAGRVIIALAPAFAPLHAANIKLLAHEHYFDGAFIERSQDNYVVQWGYPDDVKAPKLHKAKAKLAPEFEGPIPNVPFTELPDTDTYAAHAGFSRGFPVAHDLDSGKAWMLHCYAMVGVGRGNETDSGSGTELYTVIGQAPRHLDRNIALVGRVVKGIELLSVMPRGTGDLGFYKTAPERPKITSIRLATDVPRAEQTPLEMLKTGSATFNAVVASRRDRREDWFKVSPGHINVCNVPLPVRPAK